MAAAAAKPTKNQLRRAKKKAAKGTEVSPANLIIPTVLILIAAFFAAFIRDTGKS